jgi:predicted MPP superfamily phosphohydrolase
MTILELMRWASRESPEHAGAAPKVETNTLQMAALYVTRGLGTFGFPVRIGIPPEITLLTLRRAWKSQRLATPKSPGTWYNSQRTNTR